MRILIVEDDQGIRDFLKMGFEAEMFTVDVAADGEKGSFLARTNSYDLIILDNVLPLKSGQEVCREIRTSGKNTAIIMLSIQSEVLNKVGAFELGADDYVTKPFSFVELLARVRAVLRRPHQIEGEILEYQDLTMNLSKHQLFRGDKEIYLTRKEFELMGYFIRNHGIVLTRGMIIEHIWDVNADPFSNTIETHVLNLRKKIDRGAKQKLIQTVPGRGYKLDLKR